MNIIEQALRVAVTAHRDQVRKSDGSPYVAHPIMVGFILKTYGFSDEVVAAAFVHDVLEDTSVTESEFTMELGSTVARIVTGVSEDKSMPWEERKAAYAAALATADESVKAVSIADKIHNAESIINDYASKGNAVWDPFSRGKETKLWFEELVYSELSKDWSHPLLERYRKAIDRLHTLGG